VKTIKELLSEKGSVFIISMLIFALLSVLGLALITVSTGNFVMANSYIDVNKAYYAADGIMEQIYVALKQLSIEYNRFELPNKIHSAFNEIINNETDEAKGKHVEIEYDTSIITWNNDINFPVTVTYSINNIKKTIAAEFILQVPADVGPIFSYATTSGGDIEGENTSKVNLKYDKGEVIHIGGEVDDIINFKSHPPEVVNDAYISQILQSFTNSSLYYYPNLNANPLFFLRSDGNDLVINIDNLDKKDVLIISTGNVVLQSTNPETSSFTAVIIAKKNIIFSIPRNKNIHISLLSPQKAEEIINASEKAQEFLSELMEELGGLNSVPPDAKVNFWKEVY
jgi:hypothetical protein